MARTTTAKKRSTGSTTAATTATGQIVVAADQPVSSDELRPAIAVYNGMVAHGWTGRFPADLDAATVRGRLVEHLAFERAVTDRGAKTRQQREAVKATEADVLARLRRLSRLVNAYYPRGTALRAAFFAKGKGDWALGRRLTAMIEGMRAHGLGELPAELSVAKLEALREALPNATDEATVGGIKTGAVTMTREQLEARTREVRLRLSALAQGILGTDSPELADFGLTPKTSARRKTSSKRAAKTPAAGKGSSDGEG